MEHPDWLDEMFGYLGSSLLIISLIPQIYQSFSTQKLDDISSWTLGIELTTSVMFLTYGIIIDEIPMIYGNGGVIIELIILCFAKWKFRNNNNRRNSNIYHYRSDSSNMENGIGHDSLYEFPGGINYEMQNIRRRNSSSDNMEGSTMTFKNIFSPLAETGV